jgi:hypothetical protein
MTHFEYDGCTSLCGIFDPSMDVSSSTLRDVNCQECKTAAEILIEPEPAPDEDPVEKVRVVEDMEATIPEAPANHEPKQFALGYEGVTAKKERKEGKAKKKGFKLVQNSKANPLTEPEKAVETKAIPINRKPKATDIVKMNDKDRKKTAELGVKKMNLKKGEAVPPHPPVPFVKKVKGQLCKCGCGGMTKGGTFRPGHDSKYYAKLAKEGKKTAHGKG